MNDLPALQDAIRKLHGCKSRHVGSVPVRETSQDKAVWEGTVEESDLIDHPNANRCYAWNHDQDDGGTRYIAVLELPPADSARRAVKLAIAAHARKGR